MKKRTKITVTLGPSSTSPTKIAKIELGQMYLESIFHIHQWKIQKKLYP